MSKFQIVEDEKSINRNTPAVNPHTNIDVPTTTSAGLQRTLQHLLKVSAPKNIDSSALAVSEDDVTRVANMSPEEMEKWTDVILGKVPGMISDTERVRDMILPTLVNIDNNNEQAIMDQLVQLNYLVEITPIVDVFMHADGVKILRPFFESRFADVREAAWLCITSCVQNNVKFQRHMQCLQLSKTFLYLLEKETEAKVQYKLLSVIGGYLRGYEPVCRELLKLGTIDRLLRFSCSEDIIPKVYLRAQRVIGDLVDSGEYSQFPTLLSCRTLAQVKRFLIANSESSEFDITILKNFLRNFANRGPEFRECLVNSNVMSFVDEQETELKENIKSKGLFL